MDKSAFFDHIRTVSLDRGGNVSDAIFHILRDLILTGRLKSGFAFPNEMVMGEAFGVGRSTVREAYTSLVRQNLVTRSKAGTIVNSRLSGEGCVPFDQILGASEISDIMDLRVILESGIARLAAERASKDTVTNLFALIDCMRQAKDDIAALTVYDTRFHVLIAEATANPLLCSVFTSVKEQFEKLIFRAFKQSVELSDKAIAYHERIAAAIEAHDSERAIAAMNEHLQSVLKAIKAQP